MNTIKLEIVTPSGQIFSGSVTDVLLPGKEGEFGVFPDHASLVSLLDAGVIDFGLDKDNRELVAINWGYVKVNENSVDVLVDGAVVLNADSDSAIAESIAKANELVKEMADSRQIIANIESTVKRKGK